MTGRFTFGENWNKYLDEMPSGAVDEVRRYIADWIPDLTGLRFLDVGSGQGLTSLVAHEAGAEVVSFDVDPGSVEATRRLWRAAGEPTSWSIYEGSILDESFVSGLGAFDVVSSWGVLHHTGDLWQAIDASSGLVRSGGLLWIALYHRTPQSGRSLRTKQLYARLPRVGQTAFRSAYIGAKVAKHLVVRRSLAMMRDQGRGMTWRRNVEDWLGGLPYEVSSPGQVLARLRPQGFTLERLDDGIGEGGNDVYLFRLTNRPEA